MSDEYQPARKEGEIVPLSALLHPSDIFEDDAALKGFRLVVCTGGMGDRPYEEWITEVIGGCRDGYEWKHYVLKPGHERPDQAPQENPKT